MEYHFAKEVVHIIELLENTSGQTQEYILSEVIGTVRTLKNDLKYPEIEKILINIEPVFSYSKQKKQPDESMLSYFSGNMNGDRSFDKKYKKIFLKDCSLPIIHEFLNDFIEDLKLADNASEKRDIEYSLRNLEVYFREYISIKENKTVNEQIAECFKKTIEVR